jgi:hypothetical protein
LSRSDFLAMKDKDEPKAGEDERFFRVITILLLGQGRQ